MKTNILISILILLNTIGLAQEFKINNSIWFCPIDSIYADTLKFTSSIEGIYYYAEMGYENRIEYRIVGDTIFLNIYDLVSNIDSSKGEEVKSKWTLIHINNELKPIYIAHKFHDSFNEIKQEYYHSIGVFRRIE